MKKERIKKKLDAIGKMRAPDQRRGVSAICKDVGELHAAKPKQVANVKSNSNSSGVATRSGSFASRPPIKRAWW
jgi:hypothetical protein